MNNIFRKYYPIFLIIFLIESFSPHFLNAKSINELLKQLSDFSDSGSYLRRSSAAKKLGKKGAEAKVAVNALISALSDKDPWVTNSAAWALGEIGDKRAVGPLGEVLYLSHWHWVHANRSEIVNARVAAAEALRKLKSQKAVGFLVGILTDEDEAEHIREKAIWELGEIGSSKATGYLIPLIDDPNRGTRIETIKALSKIRDRRSIEAIIKSLNTDSDLFVRKEAAYALGRTRNKIAINPLIDALQTIEINKERIYYDNMMYNFMLYYNMYKSGYMDSGSLNNIIGNSSIPSSMIKIKDENFMVRAAAAKALGEIGDMAAVSPLISALEDGGYGVKESAYNALIKTGKPSVQFLIDIFNDPVKGQEAISIVKAIGEPAIEVLISNLNNNDVNMYVENILRKIGAPAIKALINTINKGILNIYVNELLIKIHKFTVIPFLVESLKIEGNPGKRFLIEILGKIKAEEAIDLICKELKSENYELKRYAAKALKEIGSDRSMKILVYSLINEENEVDWSIASILIYSNELNTLSYLIDVLKEVPESLKWDIKKILVLINEPIIPYLLDLLREGDNKLKGIAAKIILEIGAPTTQQLIELLNEENQDTKSISLSLLNTVTGENYGFKYKKWTKWFNINRNNINKKSEITQDVYIDLEAHSYYYKSTFYEKYKDNLNEAERIIFEEMSKLYKKYNITPFSLKKYKQNNPFSIESYRKILNRTNDLIIKEEGEIDITDITEDQYIDVEAHAIYLLGKSAVYKSNPEFHLDYYSTELEKACTKIGLNIMQISAYENKHPDLLNDKRIKKGIYNRLEQIKFNEFKFSSIIVKIHKDINSDMPKNIMKVLCAYLKQDTLDIFISEILFDKGFFIVRLSDIGVQEYRNETKKWGVIKELLNIIVDSIRKKGAQHFSVDIQARRSPCSKKLLEVKKKEKYLISAVENNSLKDVKKLIEKEVDLNEKNNFGQTALTIALRNKYIDIAKVLIENGADIKNCKNRLINYSFGRDLNITKLLLEKGVDINAKDSDGYTVLLIEAYKTPDDDDLNYVRFLLESGADVNLKNEKGETALLKAVWRNNLAMVKLLLENGADVNLKNEKGETALLKAVWIDSKALQIDSLAMVKLLLENGADVNAKNKEGGTALMCAAFYNSLEIAKLLIEKGADVNAKNKYDVTALMRAASKGLTTIANLLIEHGANVNAKAHIVCETSDGTALMCAVKKGMYCMAELLLEKGADVNSKDKYGQDALKFAIHNGYVALVELLAKNGAAVDRKYPGGWTPWKIARQSKHFSEISQILEKYKQK